MESRKQKEDDGAKKIAKNNFQQAGKCSKIMELRGGGQCECEILGVKAVLSCQNANLTVMRMSHFK